MNIQQLLNQVNNIIQTHKKYANQQGENFNIFSILKMERKEVETHSRFIYELLNPKGLHGQGDIFLTSFADIVLGLGDYASAKNPTREDLTAEIEKDRRIDFTLETDKSLVGIEMKIDAKDLNNQLFDYYIELENRLEKIAKTKEEVQIFYLSLSGKEASEKSADAIDYKCISFENEILQWIENCIQKSAEKSVLREALIQYKLLIEKLTGKNQDMKNEIVELLLKNNENFTSAIEIEKSLTQAKINLQIKFWETLSKNLEKQKIEFSFVNKDNESKEIKELCNNYYTNKSHKNYGLKITCNNKNLYIKVFHNIYYEYENNTSYPQKMVRFHINDFNNKTCSIGRNDPKTLNGKKFDDTNHVLDLLNENETTELTNHYIDEIKIFLE